MNLNFEPIKKISIEDAIHEYFNEMKAIDRLSKTSIYNRTFELNRFRKYCIVNNIIYTENLSKNIIISYLGKLKVSKSSKKTIMFILEQFMDFMVSESLIIENWVSLIPKPKTYLPDSDHLTLEEINILFQSEARNSPQKYIDRNLLLLSLFTNLCLRVSEVINLKFDDVRLELNEIWIKRKREKITKIHLNDNIVDKFKNWYEIRNDYKGCEQEWVFLSSRGNQLTPRQTRYIVGQSLKRAHIKKRKKGTHLLRHSGASLLSHLGENPTIIQYLLGHENIATTNRYLHFNDKALKEMIQRSPKFGT